MDTKIVKTNFSIERYQYRYLLKELSVNFGYFKMSYYFGN